MEIEVLIEKWPLPNPLRIMGRTYTEIELVATIMRDVEFEGCSEAAGIDYLGETPANIAADIASLHEVFGAGMDRARRPSGGRRLEFPNNKLKRVEIDVEADHHVIRTGDNGHRRADNCGS